MLGKVEASKRRGRQQMDRIWITETSLKDLWIAAETGRDGGHLSTVLRVDPDSKTPH